MDRGESTSSWRRKPAQRSFGAARLSLVLARICPPYWRQCCATTCTCLPSVWLETSASVAVWPLAAPTRRLPSNWRVSSAGWDGHCWIVPRCGDREQFGFGRGLFLAPWSHAVQTGSEYRPKHVATETEINGLIQGARAAGRLPATATRSRLDAQPG